MLLLGMFLFFAIAGYAAWSGVTAASDGADEGRPSLVVVGIVAAVIITLAAMVSGAYMTGYGGGSKLIRSIVRGYTTIMVRVLNLAETILSALVQPIFWLIGLVV